jgi:hypothetical protein
MVVMADAHTKRVRAANAKRREYYAKRKASGYKRPPAKKKKAKRFFDTINGKKAKAPKSTKGRVVSGTGGVLKRVREENAKRRAYYAKKKALKGKKPTKVGNRKGRGTG